MTNTEMGHGGEQHMMKQTIGALCVTGVLLFAGQVQAITVAPGSAGGSTQSAKVAPKKPSAPLPGTITGIDLNRSDVVINGQHFLISPGLVALIDKRKGADGLLSLNTLQPGMYVSYRTEKAGDATRVVEMWVLRGPSTARMK
jgi:hypothetical protein